MGRKVNRMGSDSSQKECRIVCLQGDRKQKGQGELVRESETSTALNYSVREEKF